MINMTKYQEKTFYDYIQTIEYLSNECREKLNGTFKSMDVDEEKKTYRKLIEIRIEFFKWFKKQILKNLNPKGK